MAVITMKQLLEAGVHFGHQTRKWNPKMKKYIFAARHDIHIIDLELTAKLIEEAYTFVVESVKAGKSVLFVGTKKQAQDAIKEEAERCGQYYVNSRWLGGCLTNFKTMRGRIDYLEKLERMEANGAKAYLVNTGWNGTGKRITIKDTRGIIDAILSGDIRKAPTKKIPYFNLEVPTELPGVDTNILDPRDTYAEASQWEEKAKDLAGRFIKNFAKYEGNEAGKALVAAGPQL